MISIIGKVGVESIAQFWNHWTYLLYTFIYLHFQNLQLQRCKNRVEGAGDQDWASFDAESFD